MKIFTINSAILLLFLSMNSSCIMEKKNIDKNTRWVIETTHIYEKPDLHSKKIAALSFGSDIFIESISKKKIDIFDNKMNRSISGFWYKILWGDKKGWVFGGYLES